MTTAGSDFDLVLIAELQTEPHLQPQTSLPASLAMWNKASRLEEERGGVADHQPVTC